MYHMYVCEYVCMYVCMILVTFRGTLTPPPPPPSSFLHWDHNRKKSLSLLLTFAVFVC